MTVDDPQRVLELVEAVLRRGSVPEARPGDEDVPTAELLREIAELHRFAAALARGELGGELHSKGAMAGALKSLQASLRHLTWQAQRIAAGDFSQRVDFMGGFSDAFNAMVEALADARERLNRQNGELTREVGERRRVEHELRMLTAELGRMANIDKLTDALNRRGFEQMFARSVEMAARFDWPLSLIMMDLDHFKMVNDQHGHQTGDLVLTQVAELSRQALRSSDSLVRYGGEEFVIHLPRAGRKAATVVAERMRGEVAGADFGEVGRVTVSLGVATLLQGESAADLLRRADAAMYRAKEDGRNRVVADDPQPRPESRPAP